jgi:transposase
MSLPNFSTQAELFSTAALSASLFPEADRYRLFAKLVYPPLAGARASLEKCYCPENGRTAIEPVLLLGVSILQDLDGVPDRQAVEMLRYHAGWNFALNRQLGDEVFHPTSLVNFRHRLEEHQQSALGFTTLLSALEQAGLISRQSRQRLDSTQMFGRVARMSRLDCVRESLRLALQELAAALEPAALPATTSNCSPKTRANNCACGPPATGESAGVRSHASNCQVSVPACPSLRANASLLAR